MAVTAQIAQSDCLCDAVGTGTRRWVWRTGDWAQCWL